MFFTHSRQDIEKNRQFYKSMYDSEHQLIQLDQLIKWNEKEIRYSHPFPRIICS